MSDTMNENDGNLRKAAILIASLDRDSADLMISQLSPRQAAAIRRAVVELSEIDPAEQTDVITQFVQIQPTTAEPHLSGIELDGALAERIESAEPANSDPTSTDNKTGNADRLEPSPNDEQPFRFLHEAQDDQLAPMLAQEHPQTVAVVLAHLPPERSAELLATFSGELQVDVVQRLVHLEQTDPEILQDIEHEIESWLYRKIGAIGERFAGFAAASTIVNASDLRTKSRLIANLSQRDAPLAERLESMATAVPQPTVEPFRFDELESFDADRLGLLLSMTSTEVISLALAGASPLMVERALTILDTNQSRTIRLSIGQLGPTSLRDIEAAQQELTAIATSLFRAVGGPDSDSVNMRLQHSESEHSTPRWSASV